MIEGNVVEEISKILGVEFDAMEEEAIGTALVRWAAEMDALREPGTSQMTKAEALEVLKLHSRWNTCQKGLNPEEERILVGRRALIEEAQRVLTNAKETER